MRWLQFLLSLPGRLHLPKVEDVINARQRRIYLTLLPLGVLVTLLDAFDQIQHDDTNPFNILTNVGLAFGFAVLALLLWRFKHSQRLVEYALYLLVAAFLLSNWYVDFAQYRAVEIPREILAWSIWLIVMHLVGFLTFSPQEGAVLSSLVYLASAAIGLGFVLPELLAGRRPPGLDELIQAYAATAIALIFLYRIGSLRQRYALIDFLTGVSNRRHLYQLFTYEVERARRYRQPFSVVLFDVDNFKQVNDTHGHLMGDRVLKGLTQLTLRLLRNVDDLGRWGGEEFLILLPETDVVGAQRLAERVRSALAQQRFDIAGSVTASFGVTTYLPNDTLETMLHRADEALYQAKREGRNHVAVSLAAPHAPTT